MKTELDALLTALYVYLDDHVMPSPAQPRKRGRPPVLTSAEAVVVAVAQVLLRCDQERYWLRTAVYFPVRSQPGPHRNAPRAVTTRRNLAIGALRLTGADNIARRGSPLPTRRDAVSRRSRRRG
ncbi:hypothetical protein AB0K12_45750 [Nonomuraea sp. NPDC049419]|uniref:hypothetical protein n=1 Tax=Nonomuraea sp. NPDC049419 TaxID=3155772 RepID=UPI00343A6610